MGYYINEKEVGYAEYIKYLEEVILSINRAWGCWKLLMNGAVTVINENKERR